MEISSEHGYNPGDEDIDIDIDLTGAFVDEDHVLEDVMSSDNDRNQRLTPPTSHDDLMVDDDDDNESTNMEDAGASVEEDRHIEEETPNHNMDDRGQAMSFDAAEDVNIAFDDEDTDVQYHQGTETSWEYQEVPLEQNSRLDEHPPEYKEVIEHGHEEQAQEQDYHAELEAAVADQYPDTVLDNTTKNEASESPPPRRTSSLVSSQRLSPKPEGSVKAPSETPASPSKAFSSDGINETDDKVDRHENDQVEVKVNVEKAEELTNVHKVKVIYQDVEYDLFSAPGSDDPESFFLSDLSVGKLPLASFFAAIRDIIREDISEDELLFITIEDLGLDFHEVSCVKATVIQPMLTIIEQESSPTENITLWSIIELHQVLQKNDGVEDLQPLFILLDKKMNSSHRFADMVARAAEGTGLSELTMWDDSSEHLELLVDDVELHQENHEYAEESNDDDNEEVITPETAKVAETKAEEKVESENSDFIHGTELQQSTSNEISAQESPELSEQSAVSVTNVTGDNAQVSSTTDLQYPFASDVSITVHSNDKYIEEDDLIDYSDDEPDSHKANRSVTSQSNEVETDETRAHNGTSTCFFSPCYKPQICFCYECNLLMLAEFQEKDEDFGRRSLPPAKENDTIEEETSYPEALGANLNQVTVALEDEDGVDYDDDLPEENSRSVVEVVQHEDPTKGDDECISVEPEQNNTELLIDGEISVDAQNSEFPQEFDLGEDPADGPEHNQEYLEDELDLGDGDDDEHEHDQGNLGLRGKSPRTDNYQIGVTDEPQSSPKDLNETNGLEDLVDTESAESENTLVAHPEVELEELEDEIGYDDDEEDAAAIHKVASQTNESLPLVATGPNKRARSDVSFEDSMETNGTYLFHPCKRHKR